MLDATRNSLLASIDPAAVVLDIGGWADPFERADWVLDLMPYDTRGLYEREGWVVPRSIPDRFTRERWIQRDICDHDPFPFEDGSIDFVICSHTLEDVRDPVWVCREMNRVAKAGYIEVPSRLEEQSWGVMGQYGVGWAHHRWLIEVEGRGIEFVLKPHSLHGRLDQHLPPGFWPLLSEAERIESLLWEDGFSCHERVFVDEAESDAYLSEAVARGLARHPLPSDLRSRARRLRNRAGRRLMAVGSG